MPKKIEEVDIKDVVKNISFGRLEGAHLAPRGIIRSSHYETINGKKVKVIDDIELTGVSIMPKKEA